MPLKEMCVVAGVVWLGICVVSLPEWSLKADKERIERITRQHNEAIQRKLKTVIRDK